MEIIKDEILKIIEILFYFYWQNPPFFADYTIKLTGGVNSHNIDKISNILRYITKREGENHDFLPFVMLAVSLNISY